MASLPGVPKPSNPFTRPSSSGSTTGGMSTETGPKLVTPEGKVVGSASPGRGSGSRSLPSQEAISQGDQAVRQETQRQQSEAVTQQELRSRSITSFQGQKQQLVLTRAPTLKEQYREAIKDKNPVTATKDFVISLTRDKLRRSLDQASKGEGRQGQNVFAGKTGERVQQLAGVGTYFIPFVGPALAVAEGGAQILTKGGRAETNRIAESVQTKSGINKGVVKGAIFGLSGLAILGGSRSLISQSERALGLPKFSTRFVSQQNALQQADDVSMSSSRSVALTEQKNLFSTRNFISGTETKTVLTPTGEDITAFKSATRGVTREMAAGFPTGKPTFSKPKPFVSAETGQIKNIDDLALGNLEVNQGFVVESAGKNILSKGDSNMFLSKGFGGTIRDTKFVISKTVQVKDGKALKSGQGVNMGIFKDVDDTPNIIFKSGSGNQKFVSPNQINQDIQRRSIENTLRANALKEQARNIFLGKASNIASVSAKGLENINFRPTITGAVTQQQENRKIFSTTAQKENVKQDQTPQLIQSDKLIERQQERFRLGSSSSSKQISSPIQNDISRQISNTLQDTQQKSILRSRQISRQPQQPRQETRRVFPFLIPITKRSALSESKRNAIENFKFEVFGRRFGKDISLGKFGSQKEAEKKLSSFLKGTLARSGKIKRNGSELKFEDINLGLQFRPSKKDRSRVVQKAKFSLGSFGERREILGARKSKSNKVNRRISIL